MEQLELDFREWKQVPCFEGAYELRNDGLLYSYPRQGTKGGYTIGHFDKGWRLYLEIQRGGLMTTSYYSVSSSFSLK